MEFYYCLYELIGFEIGLGFFYIIFVRVSRCCFLLDLMVLVNWELFYCYCNIELRV